MNENQESINQLLQKLEALVQKQNLFNKEISDLRDEIVKLKTIEKQEVIVNMPIAENNTVTKPTITPQTKQNYYQFPKNSTRQNATPKISIDFEKFIGENLISKIGIIITVIGVAIGAKYSIDHQLISPSTRIILGYLMGIGLLGVGFKLKKNYENYSAVLVSGAIAIMYFITFAAYSFYGLIPQLIAFGLMVIFTIFTVVVAINYNKQIIAHIGLVGAYAVPFLLSDGSGKVAVMFTYMTIINIGILIIALKKYWKPLYYSSFAISWIIYLSWFNTQYAFAEHFSLAMIFAVIFFATFYAIFLVYKLLRNEKYEIWDVALLLSNSFIFYGIGYALMNDQPIYKHFLGFFTICNAFVHCIVSILIYKQKLGDRNLFYLVSGLVLIFLTISIPIQLNGNWVTLLWVGEAALLFWIGRTKNIPFYEILSYPIMLLAFFSILIDWSTTYHDYSITVNKIIPIFNINFLSSLLFIASFGFINSLNQNKNYIQTFENKSKVSKFANFFIPAILLFVIYFSFRLEIANYFDILYAASKKSTNEIMQNASADLYNSELLKFKSIWLLNYSLLFLTILSFVNIKKLKNTQLGLINIAFNSLAILIFLFAGLYQLSELRDSYLQQNSGEIGIINIGIRYICFGFLTALFFANYKYIYQDFIRIKFYVAFDFVLYSSIIWIASSELINWMDIAHSSQSYKLGLSILWGVYSLLIIVLGIWKKKKHLRIFAIALFTATLLKLFFYDISYLDTISKTIVFVSLGVLLLIISFLYNKFKKIISEE